MTDGMLREIEAFFHDYADAVAKDDFDQIAALHHVPCLKAHGTSDTIDCLQSHDSVRDFFRDLSARYKTRGLRPGRFADLEVTPIGGLAALATLTWEQPGDDGVIARRSRRSYTMVRRRNGWLIMAAIGHRPPDVFSPLQDEHRNAASEGGG
ncbi:MAG: nuclear transport factor 2 family protein [Elsteraceae bacterium]